MRIPNKIKVGGITYKIELVDDNQLDGALGHTFFNESLIRINKECNKEQQESAFIHELCHCINTQLTEEQIDFLSLSLYQIYQDNFK